MARGLQGGIGAGGPQLGGWHADRSWGPAGPDGRQRGSKREPRTDGHRLPGPHADRAGARHKDRRPDTESARHRELAGSSAGPRHRGPDTRPPSARESAGVRHTDWRRAPDTESDAAPGPDTESAGARHKERRAPTQRALPDTESVGKGPDQNSDRERCGG